MNRTTPVVGKFRKSPSSRSCFKVAVEALETRSLLSSVPVILWKMAPKIYNDPAHGNAPDLPNTSAYVNPVNGYQVLLDASHTSGIRSTSTFTWYISQGSPSRPVDMVRGVKPEVSLPEGSYNVQVGATGLRGTTGTVYRSASVTVKDVLIVSIGDSYASGEGNPVVRGNYVVKSPQWAYSPDPAMNVENAKGHRSTLSASAQFALALQESEPQEAVTFVSVANSGATIAQGLLGPKQSNNDSDYTLPAEIEEVQQIVGTHPINVLTVSIGGNDIGFSTRIQQLATNTLFGDPSLSTIQSQVDAGLATLTQQYAALGTAIKGLKPAQVLITQYPDLTRNQDGQYAPIKLLGVNVISKADSQFASEKILAPLNQAIQTAAQANGWTYVNGLTAAFRTHGYPSTDSWFRSVGESLQYEASLLGSFHPNEAGQLAIAQRLLDVYDQALGTVAS